MNLTHEHLEQLRIAKNLLERPGLTIQLTNLLGVPIEKGFEKLPGNLQEKIAGLTQQALERSLETALTTIGPRTQLLTGDLAHKLAVTVTGAAGGAFGLPALSIELPVSTTLMLRSIADIARAEGEDLQTGEARMACLEVFALGGRSSHDDTVESAYYTARFALASAMKEAARYLAARPAARTSAPPLVRFIAQVASRFGITVSEKAAAQAVPIVGAAGGAVINILFLDHFQNMARGHFAVRHLERIYTPAAVEAAYKDLQDP